ncbi:MAG: MFS transporter [Firmicutes bacterium]|nr:MFS transporter [Bacillota bacterium]
MARRHFWVIFLILAVYVIYVWDRFVFSVELPQIMRTLHLSLTSGGFLASVFQIGLALTSLLGAYLAAKWGNRWIIVIGVVLFSAFTALTALSTGFYDTLVYRIGSGLGEGLYNIGIFTFLGALSARRKGASIGIGASLFGLGSFTGPLIASWLLVATGDWRIPFVLFGILGLIGGWLIYRVVQPQDVEQAGEDPTARARRDFRELWQWATLPICVIMFADGLAVYGFISTYAVFQEHVNHLSILQTGFVLSLFGIGNIFGGIPGGFLGDVIPRRWTVAGAAVLAAIAAAILFHSGSSVALYAPVAFIFGMVTNSLYTNSYAGIQEVVSPNLAATGTGFVATIYFGIGAFSGLFIGGLASHAGWAAAGLWVIEVPMVVGALLMALMGPRRRYAVPTTAPVQKASS